MPSPSMASPQLTWCPYESYALFLWFDRWQRCSSMCFFALVAFVLTITESKSGSGSRSALSDSCNPTDWSPQSPLSIGILQAEILEWVALSPPCTPSPKGILPTQGSNRGLPNCRRFFTHWATRKAHSYRSADSVVSSVQFSHSVVSDSLRPHESQHARTPCPSQF